MKTCSRCKENKDESEFPFKNKAKQILGSECKPCRRLSSREHYNRNKRQYIDRAQRTKANRKTIWDSFKDSLMCSACGEDDSCCLDFHHVDDKEFVISESFISVSKERLITEVAKCAILCSNCHRKHHAGRLTKKFTTITTNQMKILLSL